MSLAALSDDDDAAFADRDREDPRPDIGYRAPAPVVPMAPNMPGRGTCRDCDAGHGVTSDSPSERGVPLFQRPRATGEGAAHRVVCAECAGKSNRRHTGEVIDAVRALAAAMVTHDQAGERDAHQALASLVGREQADQTAAAIRERANEKPAKGKRR